MKDENAASLSISSCIHNFPANSWAQKWNINLRILKFKLYDNQEYKLESYNIVFVCVCVCVCVRETKNNKVITFGASNRDQIW